MKPGRYSEEQIVRILNEGASGMKVADLCRNYGMSLSLARMTLCGTG